ncbi:hypothetical protein OIU76_027237 [Salix suchowensis]|nr:hypothetical protein OIU76_027237 [Salix suchowensis]
MSRLMSKWVDPMQMETDVGEWTVVKKRNGKSKVANNNAAVVTDLGDPVCPVGIDVDPLCGVTTRSGSRRSSVLPRGQRVKALAPSAFMLIYLLEYRGT